MTKNSKSRWISQTQDSISKQGAVDRATEIALNPVWMKATPEQKQQILADISLLGKFLYFEKNILPTREDYIKLYNLDNKD